jgi:hypothetical protein
MGMCMSFSNDYAGSCMVVHSYVQACTYGYGYACVTLGCTVMLSCAWACMHMHGLVHLHYICVALHDHPCVAWVFASIYNTINTKYLKFKTKLASDW